MAVLSQGQLGFPLENAEDKEVNEKLRVSRMEVL